MNHPAPGAFHELPGADATLGCDEKLGPLALEHVEELPADCHRELVTQRSLLETECASHPAACPRLDDFNRISSPLQEGDRVPP